MFVKHLPIHRVLPGSMRRHSGTRKEKCSQGQKNHPRFSKHGPRMATSSSSGNLLKIESLGLPYTWIRNPKTEPQDLCLNKRSAEPDAHWCLRDSGLTQRSKTLVFIYLTGMLVQMQILMQQVCSGVGVLAFVTSSLVTLALLVHQPHF